MTVLSPARPLKVRCDAAGVHFFDRRSGLNVLLNEVQIPRERWALAPRHIAVALTNACDLHCPFCYAPKHRASLVPERVLGWLKEADAAGCLGVGFGGGEPTVAPGFTNLCRHVAADTSLAVSLTTHGHRIDEEVVDALAGSVHFVRVSVDGVGDTYERLRGRPYSQLVQRLRLVADLAPFGLNVVVNDDTVGDLDAVADLALDVGAAEILLLPEQPTAAGEGPGISDEADAAFRAWVSGYRRNVRISVSEQAAGELPVAEPFGDQPAIDRYAHVDASGFVRATSFSASGVRIGDDGLIAAYQRLKDQEGR